MKRTLFLLAVTTSLVLTGTVRGQDNPSQSDDALITGSIPPSSMRTLSLQGVDIARLKQALALAEKGQYQAATAFRFTDPVANTLIESIALRASNDDATTPRLQQFLAKNPEWPSAGTLRSKIEANILAENKPAAEVIAHFNRTPPRSGAGRIALAQALLASGQTARAQALVHEAWGSKDLSSSVEDIARDRVGRLITAQDDKRRMDMFLYAEENTHALRLVKRLGSAQLALVKARIAVNEKHQNALRLLEAVPLEARKDPLYTLTRIQYSRRNERIGEATDLMMQAPRSIQTAVNGDEWWNERRVLARKVLDEGNAATAYKICANHGAQSDVGRMEAEFHAGWIALRFLNDASTADRHFANVQKLAKRAISASRGHYWRGRSSEALGDTASAKNHYQSAAQIGTTYYGQLARVKLGQTQLALNGPRKADEASQRTLERRPAMRAIQLFAAMGQIEKARPFFLHLADTLNDAEELAALARFAEEMGQHRYALLVGKQANARGVQLDYFAFPTAGLPTTPQAGPSIERAVVYGIARQESTFDPKITSTAGAVGLLQMLPRTAAETAKKYGVPWQPKRLYEPAYNAQLGAAHLGELAAELQGSYVLTFAAYNAGRSRVREWIGKYGDPRQPNVDPVDWVERIPFSETRNYVMRVMENVQVYRTRLTGNQALRISDDMRRFTN